MAAARRHVSASGASTSASSLLVAFGNFDLAFVLVFLVPLLVIALTYKVWSADQCVTCRSPRIAIRTRALVLFPPALFQRALNAMAGTDLQSHLTYLDSVTAYHEALKAWFLPAIFDNRTVAAMDWSSAPRHEHVARPRRDAFVAGVSALLAIVAVLIGAAGLLLAGRLAPGESSRTRQPVVQRGEVPGRPGA